MSLAGAIIIILAMANALINYAIQEQIPNKVLDAMISFGLSQKWQFLIVLNIFLVVLGMVMDGFSAILVAVPLILPFGARFGLHPFHLAMMFLLNLEIAYCAPPLGLNLYISSFRFNRPVVSLYKIVLPATAILTLGLLIVMYVPKVSTVLVDKDSAAARAEALAKNEPPREAWRLECVQEDQTQPQPCSEEDKKRYPGGNMPAEAKEKKAKPTTDAPKEDEEPSDEDDDARLKRLMKKAAEGASGKAPAKDPEPEPDDEDDDARLKRLMREAAGKK